MISLMAGWWARRVAAIMDVRDAYVRAFKMLRFIRESAPNDGEGVRFIQAATDNRPPDKWCASTATRVGIEMLGERWPLVRSAACTALVADARRQGFLLTDENGPVIPQRGDLFFIMKSDTVARHVGVVDEPLADRRFTTAEGNAADPARPSSVDGNGLYAGRVRGGPGDRRRYFYARWANAVQ